MPALGESASGAIAIELLELNEQCRLGNIERVELALRAKRGAFCVLRPRLRAARVVARPRAAVQRSRVSRSPLTRTHARALLLALARILPRAAAMRRGVGLPEEERTAETKAEERDGVAPLAARGGLAAKATAKATAKAAGPRGANHLTAKVGALRANLSKLRKKHAALKRGDPVDLEALAALTATYQRRKAALKTLERHLADPSAPGRREV